MLKYHHRVGGIDLDSLIPSVIHVRASASLGVYHRPLSSQKDLCGRSWTVVLNPEKRKVGGSTPPLTTSSDLRKRALSNCSCASSNASSLIFVSFISSGRSARSACREPAPLASQSLWVSCGEWILSSFPQPALPNRPALRPLASGYAGVQICLFGSGDMWSREGCARLLGICWSGTGGRVAGPSAGGRRIGRDRAR